MYLVNKTDLWTSSSHHTEYVECEPGIYEPLDLERNCPPFSLWQECIMAALRCELNKHGFPWHMTDKKTQSELTKLNYHKRRP